MVFKDTVRKAAESLSKMDKEVKICFSVLGKVSDEELMICVRSPSRRRFIFIGTEADDINYVICEMACRKAASDRGLL